ncbi:hybrid sensor histidine kinase/response regulator transcription factor [Breznakibacter xylanolyticus]|nr:two-component regulator propeller domain-containing protein [Breznakibacter xylanolyticus]
MGMGHYFYRIFVCGCLLAGIIPETAKASDEFSYHFQYLTINEGLPQNTVNAIERDAHGFMWFATGNGLSRYDGYRFRNFSKPQLPSNLVMALAQTPDSRLWIGTTGGLSYYDLTKEEIVPYTTLLKDNQPISIQALHCDTRGRLWVGTTDHGLFMLQKQGETYHPTHLDTSNSMLPGQYVGALMQLRDGRLLIGTNHGIAVFHEPQQQLKPLGAGNLQNSFILSMLETREGDLWVGTHYGAWVYNPQTGRDQWFLNNPYDTGSLSHNRVNTIIQDPKGTIYLGTLGGVNIYRPRNDRFTVIGQQDNNRYSLNNPFVKCMQADGQGNVWIGTEKGGVNQFNLYQKTFHHLIKDPQQTNSLSSNTVNAILTNGNEWWIGTAGGGLNRYDARTGQFVHYRNNPGSPSSISSDFITSLYLTPKGDLWIGTWGGGISKLQPGGTFKRLTPPVNDPETNYENAFISSLLPDERGFLYVGTEGGLAILDLKTETFRKLDPKNNALAQINEIGCMCKDRDGYVWTGTRNGLYRFKADAIDWSYNVVCPENQMQYFSQSSAPSGKTHLPGNYIASLFEDADGNIWIGTYGDGLVRCTKDKNNGFTFKHYRHTDGLSNEVIYGILQDESGFIWLSTDYGLSRLNPQREQFDNFYRADGLLSDQFYWSAAFRSREGYLFFGGTNGLNYFHPSSFPVYPHQPNVDIVGVNVFNHPVQVGEERYNRVAIGRTLSQCDTIELSYRDNVFSIEFSALDYFHSAKIKYAYQLEGVDRDWVEVTAQQRVAGYSNLAGGTYRFRVKASNSDGEWNDQERVMTIIIHPPFWQTTWFKILILLGLVLAGIGYLRYHTKRLVVQKMKLEKMVKDRTQTIEEQNERMRHQAEDLQNANTVLENRRELIENQKRELEIMNGEIVQQRDQVVELNKQIEQINQLRMTFFTNISHEFRTPLTLIIAPIEKLLREVHLPGAVNDVLTGVQRNAKRLNLLIDQLLTFRKIETGNLKIMLRHDDLGDFINDVFHAFDALAQQRNISYTLQLHIDSQPRWFDRDKLENILYNLLANAFKYTDEGGNITLTIREEMVKRDTTPSPTLVIEVSDNGIGIDEAHVSHIFERFYRTPQGSNIKGTGIGLALTRDLVEAMNGAIMVTSKVGQGSTFTVTLPCGKEAFPGAEISDLDEFEPSDLGSKVQIIADHLTDDEPFMNDDERDATDEPVVLVVEDNKELLSFLSGALSDDFRVVTAENGKTGYEMARKHSPELIISDVMMPVTDGIEMCRLVKSNLYTSHIPVILLSAKAQIENQLDGLQTGADDYIAKPFNLEILRAKVKNQIEARQRMRNLFTSQARVQPIENTPSSIDEKFLTKAYEIMESGYTNPDFNVELFADQMFVSRSLLYKKLKALVDLSPNDFITVYRLKKSLPLLASRELSVNEVAYRIGFNDPKYFSRVFKKFYKKTPSEYVG